MRLAAAVLVVFATTAVAEDVSLQTPTGMLFGTLLMPSASPPVPIVLILAGSGPTDRDGNSVLVEESIDNYKMLAESLAQRGIASLRYDKRGVGASINTRSLHSMDAEVDDAVGWLRQLQTDARFSDIVVAGHSQGALIGTLAAQRVSIHELISLSGAGRPAGDVILTQLEPSITPALMEIAREIVASLNAGKIFPESMMPAILRNVFPEVVQPYLITWFRYDPSAEIARLAIPILIVQGDHDDNVTVNDDAVRLWSANRTAELQVIPGMNHELKDGDDLGGPIDKTLVIDVVSFVTPPQRRRAVR